MTRLRLVQDGQSREELISVGADDVEAKSGTFFVADDQQITFRKLPIDVGRTWLLDQDRRACIAKYIRLERGM